MAELTSRNNLNLDKVYNTGHEILPTDLEDCYAHFAYKWGLANYRVITIGDLISAGITKEELPAYAYDVIGQYGRALMIGSCIGVNGGTVVTELTFKPFNEKYFVAVARQKAIPYGVFTFTNEFKYGCAIVVVEGFKDCDSLKRVYPFVVAAETAGLSSMSMEILLTMTNNFILAYDSDEAGTSAYKRDCWRLRERGCKVSWLKHLEGCKDSGAIADTMHDMDLYKHEALLAYYRTSIQTLL